MNDNITFLLIFAVLAIVAMIRVRNLYGLLISLLLITTSVYHTTFNPREVFNIHGLNAVNCLWVAALIVTLFKILSSRNSLFLGKYFRVPILIFLFCYIFVCIQTIVGVKVNGFSNLSYTAITFLKGMQFILTGWLVLHFCIQNKGLKIVEKAILIASIIFSFIVTIYFFYGYFTSGNYADGRDMVSGSIGMHANSVGALSLYFLFLAIFMKSHDWKTIRKLAIGCCLLGIIFSFSRMAYLTLIIMLPILIKQSRFKDTVWFILVAVVIVTFTYPFVAKRIQFGVNTKKITSTNLNKLSAGRIDFIWKPMFKEFLKRPLLGHGMLYREKMFQEGKTGSARAHNAYLQALIDGGIFTLIAATYMLVYLYFIGRRTGTELQYLIIVMMLVSLTGHTFYPSLNNNIFWVAYGMAIYKDSHNQV